MNKVAEHFERFSKNYGGQFFEKKTGTNFSFRKRLELACELAADSSGRLLDCACGTGEITCAILKSRNFSAATLNDISAAMQQRARALIESEIRGVELRFIQSDIFQFPPAAEKFDFIVCLGLIAHTGRLDDLLSHLKSVLAPGGRLLLQTTLADHPFTKIVRALSARRYFKRHGYWISYFRQGDIARACERAGLEIETMRRHGVGVPFGDRVWPRANFEIEKRLQKLAASQGVDALYRLAAKS